MSNMRRVKISDALEIDLKYPYPLRVWKNRGNNQKLVTVPKNSPISEGDLVMVMRVRKKEVENNE